jgi:single-strand selective monofunctional uracil DNA glycosylase
MSRRPSPFLKQLVEITETLRDDCDRLRFAPPVAAVYNPLGYAAASHRLYLEKWGSSPRRFLLLGMNPGPFGMAQTGVPFGEVSRVRDFLRVQAAVGKPAIEHPARPIQGFDCPKSEVSGSRLWGWVEDRFQTPDRFFAEFFVINWCPLAFMEASGANRTPDKLPKVEREPLYEACDRALAQMVTLFDPEWVIGVGGFALERARKALPSTPARKLGSIPHPSPASPAANRGWAEAAEKAFAELGIKLP